MKRLTKNILILILIAGTGLLNGVVKNEDNPLKGEWNFNPQEVWIVDSAGDDFFASVSIDSVKIDENGTVYILDRKLEKVFVFSEEGKFLFSFGEKGEGPGEFKGAYDLFLIERYLIVRDRGHKIHYFTKDGKFFNSFQVGVSTHPRGFIDISRFITLRSDPDARQKKETLEIYDIKTRKGTIITEVPAEEWVTASDGSGKGSTTLKVQFDDITPKIIVIGPNKNDLYYAKSDKYLIKKTDLKGKELFSFSIEGRKRKPIPMELRKKKISNFFSILPQELTKQLIKNMPDKCTFFEKIDVDEKGMIYIYVADVTNTTGMEIDIFSPEGKYLYHANVDLKLPEGSERDGSLFMKKDNMLVLVEDEEGEKKFVNYKIKKPLI